MDPHFKVESRKFYMEKMNIYCLQKTLEVPGGDDGVKGLKRRLSDNKQKTKTEDFETR